MLKFYQKKKTSQIFVGERQKRNIDSIKLNSKLHGGH